MNYFNSGNTLITIRFRYGLPFLENFWGADVSWEPILNLAILDSVFQLGLRTAVWYQPSLILGTVEGSFETRKGFGGLGALSD